MATVETVESNQILAHLLAQTMDGDAWTREAGSPFLPQGPEWTNRRQTSLEWAAYAVAAGWRPPAITDVDLAAVVQLAEAARDLAAASPNLTPVAALDLIKAAAVLLGHLDWDALADRAVAGFTPSQHPGLIAAIDAADEED